MSLNHKTAVDKNNRLKRDRERKQFERLRKKRRRIEKGWRIIEKATVKKNQVNDEREKKSVFFIFSKDAY